MIHNEAGVASPPDIGHEEACTTYSSCAKHGGTGLVPPFATPLTPLQ